MADIKQEIEKFIEENFVMGRKNITLDPDKSLIESGVMDSTGVLELVMFLEERFSIQIDDEELVPENLDTINNLVAFLKKKGVAA
ncbi:MAG TPA: acyl carrier protein [Spirochaetota bacterium]|nr:acyl carrier protein [Spirochaetota bacterium]HPI90180.1 acyl carrier protein [Spirochaetota bacterium]HPR49619.1 acyl carrier protein [Spirochaetota bacterium]